MAGLGWQTRAIQSAIIILAGIGAALLARKIKLPVIWAGWFTALAVATVRLSVEATMFAYYWQGIMILLLVGAYWLPVLVLCLTQAMRTSIQKPS